MKLYVVLGLGQFGHHLASTLHAGGGEVLAIDSDEDRVEVVKEKVSQAVCMDATDASALRAVGVAKAYAAVVALGEEDFEASILACSALSDLGVGRIIVRAANELQGRILQRLGATQIVFPEKQMGEQLAQAMLLPGVVEQVRLQQTGQVVALLVPRQMFVGKTVKEVRTRMLGAMAVGLQRTRIRVDDKGEVIRELTVISDPEPTELIESEDLLLVIGTQAQIEQLAKRD